MSAVQVLAVCSPDRPDWRYRIVDYDGQIVEESATAFQTIARALEEGARRLHQMNGADRAGYGR